MTVLSIRHLNEIIGCPACKEPLHLAIGVDARCRQCGSTFPWVGTFWDFVLPGFRGQASVWETWDQMQLNGQISYENDPDHNLGVGARGDYLAFGKFCDFSGLVLDIGCGPQAWPAHFRSAVKPVKFVGIDPLIKTSGPEYTQLHALAEYLPFRSYCFEQAIFTTSLDHFIDPVRALMEASRVIKKTGIINIWIGEKHGEPPRTQASPEWYISLKKPEEAADPFHIERLTAEKIEAAFSAASLLVVRKEILEIDRYRRNIFFSVRHNES